MFFVTFVVFSAGVERKTVGSRERLQKNKLRPWATERFCIAEKDRARFVERMEEVLDVYQEKYDEKRPLICLDEASRQVLSDVTPPLRNKLAIHHSRRQTQTKIALPDP